MTYPFNAPQLLNCTKYALQGMLFIYFILLSWIYFSAILILRFSIVIDIVLESTRRSKSTHIPHLVKNAIHVFYYINTINSKCLPWADSKPMLLQSLSRSMTRFGHVCHVFYLLKKENHVMTKAAEIKRAPGVLYVSGQREDIRERLLRERLTLIT